MRCFRNDKSYRFGNQRFCLIFRWLFPVDFTPFSLQNARSEENLVLAIRTQLRAQSRVSSLGHECLLAHHLTLERRCSSTGPTSSKLTRRWNNDLFLTSPRPGSMQVYSPEGILSPAWTQVYSGVIFGRDPWLESVLENVPRRLSREEIAHL